MKNIAISKRYAKALMLIGKEDGKAEAYRDELAALAALLEKEPALANAISNPLYGKESRQKVLESLLGKVKPSKVMGSFLRLLFEKGRFGYVGHINEFYQKLADELKGVTRASVISATKLSKAAVDKIRVSLSKKTGKDVVLEVEQDPSLIGGIVTKMGDLVLDGSIKTQLLNMRESFKRGESV